MVALPSSVQDGQISKGCFSGAGLRGIIGPVGKIHNRLLIPGPFDEIGDPGVGMRFADRIVAVVEIPCVMKFFGVELAREFVQTVCCPTNVSL